MTAESMPIVSSSPDPKPLPEQTRPVRLWPAIVALVLFWVGHFVISRLETFYFIGFLFNMASAALLAIFFLAWWLSNRRVSLRSRLYGLLLLIVGGLIVKPLCHDSIGWWGMLMSTLPIALTAGTLWAVVANKICPSWQRAGSIVVVALAFAYFTLVRMEGLDSNLRADVHWRWEPSPEELFLAEKKRLTDDASEHGDSPRGGETVCLSPGDWPEFRGRNRDGVIRGIRIATNWSTTAPRRLWRQRVGPAWSSVILVGGRLYTQEQRGDVEAVVCYDAQTGKELWSHTDVARFWESVSGAGPRATPTFADGRIFALGGTGILNCLDAATGDRYWSQNIAADAGTQPPQWGYSGSPLVTDNSVIVFAGGEGGKNLLAYRADTGKPAWAAPAGASSYSSPQRATLNGVLQCLMVSDHGLTAVDTATGRILWKSGTAMPGAPRAGQPHVVGAAQLLVAAYEGAGASVTFLDVNRDGAAWSVIPRWTSKNLRPEFPDFVVHRDHAYGFDVSIFCCIDLSTGKRCWKEGRYGRGQVVLLADQALLLVMSENGEMVLLAADPQRHHELGRFRALDGKTWNSPVIAHGRLYVRNAEEMACYELAPDPSETR